MYNTAGQLTSSEFAPDAVGRLTSLQAQGASPVFQWGHTYSYEANGNRTGGSISANGASMGFTSGMQGGTNRQSNAAGITVTTNAAGDITGLLGKTLAYDAAGRMSEATAVPPCPSGLNCSGAQTTTSRFNGWGQRFLRENDQEQSVFSYGLEGFNLLSQTTRNLHTSALSTTEHIWLPTASGPMPVAAVIDGTHYSVHSDHLNTPRRLSDSAGQTRWQWPYSGFGEIAPQSTPAAGQAPVSYALRYPGQVDDGNGLFYNWHRFYDPRVGRYTSADPIGLAGGFNRFGYVGANPLGFVDPSGLKVEVKCRPARIANGWVDHCWMKTDTVEAGMNSQPTCSKAGDDASGWPFSPVVVSDHSCDQATRTIEMPYTDEACVNSELSLGKALGRFSPPFNSCQTFVLDVIEKCTKKPTKDGVQNPVQSPMA